METWTDLHTGYLDCLDHALFLLRRGELAGAELALRQAQRARTALIERESALIDAMERDLICD
jgi:hypothetical protein